MKTHYNSYMGRGQNKINKTPLSKSLPKRLNDGRRYVYKLIDPRDKSIRYIGVTKNPLARRNGHKSNPAPEVKSWVDELKSLGLDFEMKIIGKPLPGDKAAVKEIRLIKEYQADPNVDLLNRAPGGALGGSDIRWDEDTAKEAILLIAKNNNYPRSKDFSDNGLHALDKTILIRLGGHQKMAEYCGLDYEPYYKWGSPEERQAGVQELMDELGINTYPRVNDFNPNGYGGLSQAIRKNEGHEAMADRFDSKLSRTDWSDKKKQLDTIKEIVTTLNLGESYPTQKQFNQLGYGGLYNYIYKNDDHYQTAEALGLKVFSQNDWGTKDKRIAGVKKVVASLDLKKYPSNKDFEKAGLQGLMMAVRHNEGHDKMAKELGLKKSRRSRSMTKEEAVQEVKDLMQELGINTYPTQRQFRAAGKSGLYSSITRSRNFNKKDILESLGL